MKKWQWLLFLFALVAVVLVACNSGETVVVHTNASNFIQSSVTLRAGESLKLVNDTSVLHVISLGTWKNGVAQPEQEPGAPNVQNQQLTANSSITIGPWKTPGTYHLYCTIHANMNLTVYVK